MCNIIRKSMNNIRVKNIDIKSKKDVTEITVKKGRKKKIILILGPSSVGKTSYAMKKYGGDRYCLIDSDQVWYMLITKFGWSRDKIKRELFNCMIKLAKGCIKLGQMPVLIHDRYDILEYVKRRECKIIVVAAKLDRLIKNFYKRNDRRFIPGVLEGWEHFFEPVDKRGKGRFLIKRDNLTGFILERKVDKVAVERFKRKFFSGSGVGDKNKSWVGVKGECDQLLVLE